MFTVIYEKETGKVLNVIGESNPENLRAAISNTNDFTFIEELPKYDFYRQRLVVNDGKLIVENLSLTEEQERQIVIMERTMEMNQLKEQLAGMDYKTSKYVDGEYTENEWQQIVFERKTIRNKIREFESFLNNSEIK